MAPGRSLPDLPRRLGRLAGWWEPQGQADYRVSPLRVIRLHQVQTGLPAKVMRLLTRFRPQLERAAPRWKDPAQSAFFQGAPAARTRNHVARYAERPTFVPSPTRRNPLEPIGCDNTCNRSPHR